MIEVSLHPELDGKLFDDPPEGWVVYFLLDAGTVVYVGATKSPAKRMEWHRKRRKKFDSVLFLGCTQDNIEFRETKWIRHFAPKYNKRHNPNWSRPRPFR